MDFEWDHNKNRLNIEKHGIDFEDARRIFDGAIAEAESRQAHGEIRMEAIGVLGDREIVVVYTWRGSKRRLISARRARQNERTRYWQTALEGQDRLGAN